MPADAVTSSPNGLPSTTIHSPTCEIVRVAERQAAARRGTSIESSARSSAVSRPTTFAGTSRAIGQHDVELGRRGGDVIVRDDVDALASMRKPVPSATSAVVSGAPGNIAAGPDFTGVAARMATTPCLARGDEIDEATRCARVEDAASSSARARRRRSRPAPSCRRRGLRAGGTRRPARRARRAREAPSDASYFVAFGCASTYATRRS